MAAMETPAPAERIAVLLAMLLPGSALRMELAVSSGFFAGVLSRRAELVVKAETAGAAERIGRVGRARAAPAHGQLGSNGLVSIWTACLRTNGAPCKTRRHFVVVKSGLKCLSRFAVVPSSRRAAAGIAVGLVTPRK